MGASTSATVLLDLESNDFKELTRPPRLEVTRSLISETTLNNVNKFFFLLHTCQTATAMVFNRVIPVTTWMVKIALGGVIRG